MAQRVELTATVSENQLGQRLDQALAELFPDYSRSRIKEWILDQRVLVNGKIWDKPKEKVFGGEAVAINAEIEEEIRFEPQDIPLDIVYEDDDILVINKPRDRLFIRAQGIQTVRYLTHFFIIIRRLRMSHVQASFTVWIKTPPV